ncbi:hypothetical protein M433DRAFT_60001 [Acidomyces richmondensis BFW]|nr:MAG: hypothetical protein FE78DRAFT_135517 [Acidomyces sp. 'richmondensis']KYG49000.1 hypothetical protein M433DRAFT_60001 [Acidomyces richmondensis BFW]
MEHGRAAMHLATRTLVERQSSTSSSAVVCTGKEASQPICQKPEGGSSSGTLAIALGAAIPLSCALIVLIFLHRRLKRRQRIEDANDPHKSLDFGVESVPGLNSKRGKGGVPEMTFTDLGNDPTRPGRAARGISMDMEMASPYLLPAGLQGSHESIHSMSRSMSHEHDPYRPVTMLRTSSESRRPQLDNASMYSASTMQSNDKSNLLRNAQRMSRSDPLNRADSFSPSEMKSNEELPSRQLHSQNRAAPPSRKTSLGSEAPLPNINENTVPPRKQSLTKDPNSPPPPPPPPPPSEPAVEQVPPPRTPSTSVTRPPRKSSASAGARATHASLSVASLSRESSDYGDEPAMPLPIPIVQEPEEMQDESHPTMVESGRFSIDTSNPSQQYPVEPQIQRMSVMGLRPIPDLPDDNPEVRANRIRSFYKEYFDESRPNPVNGHYEEDFDPGYMDGAIYDPDTGGFIMPGKPWAEAPGRRAMTPPPRGASRNVPSGPAHGRHYSTMSAGRGQMRGRPPPPPAMPRKRMPPPKALQGLPTPAKLKDYDSVIASPIDFAPPTSFRQMQNGSRPDSPMGVARPYSPSVKPYTPLVSAFDELPVIPSPHLLRKSGTFTSLDFAPPSRIKDPDRPGSDAGSIRSARSGISAMQMDAVRAGAYRVSRIPKEMVTTKDDLLHQLRPKMDLISPA